MLFKSLRALAWIEGVSFLLILFITMPLKYLADMPTPNLYVGMAHGLLFLLYVLLVVWVGVEKNWNFKKIMILLILSIIPFGTFYGDRKYLKP